MSFMTSTGGLPRWDMGESMELKVDVSIYLSSSSIAGFIVGKGTTEGEMGGKIFKSLTKMESK